MTSNPSIAATTSMDSTNSSLEGLLALLKTRQGAGATSPLGLTRDPLATSSGLSLDQLVQLQLQRSVAASESNACGSTSILQALAKPSSLMPTRNPTTTPCTESALLRAATAAGLDLSSTSGLARAPTTSTTTTSSTVQLSLLLQAHEQAKREGEELKLRIGLLQLQAQMQAQAPLSQDRPNTNTAAAAAALGLTRTPSLSSPSLGLTAAVAAASSPRLAGLLRPVSRSNSAVSIPSAAASSSGTNAAAAMVRSESTDTASTLSGYVASTSNGTTSTTNNAATNNNKTAGLDLLRRIVVPGLSGHEDEEDEEESRKNAATSPRRVSAASRIHATATLTADSNSKPRPSSPPRKGRAIKFPATLHSILTTLHVEGRSDIACFTPDGSGFCIFKPSEFVDHCLSKHFRSSSLSTFHRQVNLYCFARHRLSNGDNVFSHPKFHRDYPHWCLEMKRTKIKNHQAKQRLRQQQQQGQEHGDVSDNGDREGC